MDGFWKELERAGKEFNPYHAGFLQLVAISERDDQIEEYRPHIEYFFKKTQHLPAFFANPPGYRSLNTVRSTIGKEIAAALQTQPKEFTWKDYIDQGAVIAGSPATVREELEKAITEMRVGNLMLLLHFGDMPRERTMRNTELFAKEVMPHLKDLWSEYPHNWWPKPVGGVARCHVFHSHLAVQSGAS